MNGFLCDCVKGLPTGRRSSRGWMPSRFALERRFVAANVDFRLRKPVPAVEILIAYECRCRFLHVADGACPRWRLFAASSTNSGSAKRVCWSLLRDLDIFLDLANSCRRNFISRLRNARIVVEVVIEDHRRTAVHAAGSTGHDSPVFAHVNDVVLKYVVTQIEVHEDLASSRFPSVVVEQCIVDDG